MSSASAGELYRELSEKQGSGRGSARSKSLACPVCSVRAEGQRSGYTIHPVSDGGGETQAHPLSISLTSPALLSKWRRAGEPVDQTRSGVLVRTASRLLGR